MNVEEELEKLDLAPNEGQNFLWSENNARALAAACEPDDKRVLEIGPGLGTVTEHLAENAGEVIAVEKNQKLANHLKERFNENSVKIINEDFLDYAITEDIDRIVGNIPFQITKKVLDHLWEHSKLSALLVQEEVADKIVAKPDDKEYSFYSLKVQVKYLPVKLRSVNKRYFEPSPNVNGAIIKFYPRKTQLTSEPRRILNVIKPLFNNSNKKVRNSFVDSRHLYDIEKEQAKEIREKFDFSDKRVNRLTVHEAIDLGKQISEEINS